MYEKSFLKWPGGKFRVLDRLLKVLPEGRRLVEPFVGSGTVFLNTDYEEYLLCDVNADVIAVFKQLKTHQKAFIARCKALFVPENNVAEQYYELRRQFNNAANKRERAALFVYCNRHGYNGLVRYNAGGQYNVPFGRYAVPYFPEKEMHSFAAKLRRCNAELTVQDFTATFRQTQRGDVVYGDPPYVPLTATANFTTYAGNEFSLHHQRDLADCARQAARSGIPVVLSNHDTPLTQELYNTAKIYTFLIRRSISRNGAARGLAAELAAVFQA